MRIFQPLSAILFLIVFRISVSAAVPRMWDNPFTTNTAPGVSSALTLNNAGNLFKGEFEAPTGHGFTGLGSGLTNVPSKFVASINALTNIAGTSNLVVYVDSYFGTNWWGGGKFKWENSSATADYGNVFVANGGGRYRRIDTGYPTNFFFMEHFGVVPNAALDQYTSAQSTINASPMTAGAVILPPYGFGTATTLTYTNRRGCYFGALGGGLTVSPGYRTYPNPLSIIHWVGATGGTNLVAYDVGHTTFARFGLDTRKGVNDGTQWSAAAGLLFDVDMNATPATTTSANVFDGLYFRERGTNANLVGLRIANAGVDNCEFFRLENCYFQGGGGNYPDYWVNTTNLGAAKAIQLGGAGGGGDSFGHKMVNCGFNLWQYYLYSDGGSWDIEANYGTAAGVAAYYINGVKGSYIRSVEDEGDRRFLQSPSVYPVILEANRIAWAATSVSNIAQVDGVNLVLIGNIWNTDASNLMPAVTNSFNNTGRYFGRNNTMPQTNTTAIASWRFASSFDSAGDFGTISDNNRIQSFPARTVSLLGQTNPVWAAWTDSATFPVLTLMPSNGAVAIGGNINNVIAAIWNVDPLNKTSWQVGDQYENPRARLVPGANTSTFEVTSDQGTYLKVQSSNAVFNLVSGNGVNTINFNRGYGTITGTNDTELARFGNGALDFQIKFPYDTNFDIVGRVGVTRLTATNYISWITNDSFANMPVTPARYGQIYVVNSNATLYLVTATTSGTLGYASTNPLIAATVGAGLIVENGVLKTNGQTTGGGGAQTPWTSDIDGAGFSLTGALGVRVTSGGIGTALGGGDLFIYDQGTRVGRVNIAGGVPSFAIGPDSDSLGSSGGGNAILAGDHNTNNGDFQSVIVGGSGNVIGVGTGQAILGGANNIAAGNYNAVLGGAGNIVSNESFALGQKAYATNRAAVVIAAQDSVSPVLANTLSNEMIYLYAPNGVTINTNNGTTNALFVVGSQTVTSNLNVSGTITGNGSIIANGSNVFAGPVFFGGGVTVGNGLPSYFSNLYTTNLTIFSNAPPAAPLTYGEVGFYISNGVPYIMDSSLSGAHTWLTTNRFGSSPQQVAGSLGGLPMNGSGITNLFFGAQTNGVEANLAANKVYLTNMTAAITLAAFANVPSTTTWGIELWWNNTSGGNLNITCPNGVIGESNGFPAVIVCTNNSNGILTFKGYAQVRTNVYSSFNW